MKVSKRKQIITSIVMGSTVAALAAPNANAAVQQPEGVDKSTPSSDLIAQTKPTQQPLVPNPKITIDGAPPTPGVGLATPTMPRAVAPPVGDISVSNLDATIPQINLESNARINMVLKNTPAREVLESLARSANLNLAYADSVLSADGKAKTEANISLNLRNEPVQNAFNYVLQLSGLEANRIGNTIFVGNRLPDSVRETIVRTLRMNQVSSAAAANFLTTQGAETQIAFTKVDLQTVGEGASARTVETRTPQILALKANQGNGPLLLTGLAVSTDERLNAVTLIGSPRKVEMATSLLTRLDARRRQVALNVKIVDVNLSNLNSMSNSLSFKVGDGFLSVDKGAAVYNYGGSTPATNGQVNNISNGTPIGALNLPGGSQPFMDFQPNAPFSSQTSGDANGLGNIPRAGFGTPGNPLQPGVTTFTPAIPGTPVLNAAGNQIGTTAGTPAVYTYALPTNYAVPSKFLSTLQAQIISGNGKILTDPTLVVQEGQKSTVNLTQDVFGGFKINTVAGTGATTSTREPIIKQAGLSLEILVNRIDDNGFVSVGVSPTVSSIGSTITTTDGDISLLQSRTLNSGEIRLRDGQTLILSGIIQESDRSSVSKVPILGDIPILGALFRSTSKTNQRQEVVVLLTPQILNDNRGQVNYTPGVDARLMMGR
ncbi:secretin N-terminal domain-containing protein [Chamaesiphon minutus]|uniref:Type II secretory pathway, component HofQ n=1 Tax=Chamaesiphon minutus (strain ATCC 27169 / PCC 6605) TaxID=1173020 RepID=K9UQ51_CHAP6|nr:secretin N-terminal domain-containing protein [Chamaesiphon minutus]AFY96334.1 type II secretory pathway, component HofQ [Chamaesiphon minutus PCC 6605]